MNDRNNEGAAIAMVFAIIILVAQIIAAIVAAIVICFTVAFSLVAIIALVRDGVTLWGEHTSRKDAILFFARGAVGTVAVPLFIGLVAAILGWQLLIPMKWMLLAGFAFGSWGVELLVALDEEEKAKASAMMILPPLPEHEQYVPPVAPSIEPVRPFHFASWDDEGPGR